MKRAMLLSTIFSAIPDTDYADWAILQPAPNSREVRSTLGCWVVSPGYPVTHRAPVNCTWSGAYFPRPSVGMFCSSGDDVKIIAVGDSGGEIRVYHRMVDGGDTITFTSSSLWRTFTQTAGHTALITGTNELGASATLQATFEVFEERHHCYYVP